ncbi:HAD family hydrolase [Psychrobacter sp. FDAARGOS_221]|uniref:HAD family hydrolase n=1 Tax=Psychrobacter sp. FDAARGOS_221 TaxID=1975705 RepID=UPI000BB570A0|nr:HAD-IA family hydrolase [Psychrobacter sp. FDAARGOS_221]PNK61042.1 phosphoglycolate phosphatase [Psychrobacter sp. FDAARGOS_221]
MSTQYVKAVLFDLDGTLIDTAADFIRIIGRMSEQNNWKTPPEEAIREQVSAGAAAMVSLMLKYNDQPLTDELVQQYRAQFLAEYEADICVDSCVFKELEPLLTYYEKKQIPWGIVTNKPRDLSVKLLDELNLEERCSVLVCPDDVSITKPDPEPLYLALEKLELPRGIANSVIYVGDHIRDIQAGAAAGMTTILAGYGYIPPEDQQDLDTWGADYVVETPKKLVKLLKSKRFDYL